jgi:hypothetical protein
MTGGGLADKAYLTKADGFEIGPFLSSKIHVQVSIFMPWYLKYLKFYTKLLIFKLISKDRTASTLLNQSLCFIFALL